MKINKRFLQFIAAFLILIFHVGITMTGSETENFIIRTGYIGVDLFFFLSAYSLADKKIEYKKLLSNRFVNIYGKFVVFVIIAAFYKKFKIVKVVKALLLIELFEKGGGAFLWFVPAIMLFYIIYPPFIRWSNKYKSLNVLVCWLIISFLLDKCVGYHDIFIFTNRIPILILGYELKQRTVPQWLCVACLPVGYLLLYLGGYKYKLNIPFDEFYYIAGILAVIGLCGVSSYVKSGRLWNLLSSGTLELYGIQMIFGPKLALQIYKITKSAVVTNILVVVLLFGVSIVVAKLWDCMMAVITNRIKKE